MHANGQNLGFEPTSGNTVYTFRGPSLMLPHLSRSRLWRKADTLLPPPDGPTVRDPGPCYDAFATQTRTYSLTVEPKENGYLAYFPARPGCPAWGRTFEEAVKNAEEALAVYIETLASYGDEIPHKTDTEEPVSLPGAGQTQSRH